MTIRKIIDGLYFTIGMILFNPITGEGKTPDQLNEDDRTTYDSCMGAIELLKAQEPVEPVRGKDGVCQVQDGGEGVTEREKVIKGLECRLDINGSKYKHCLNCDYRHDIDHCQWACQTDGILEDALALLKAQEQNCRECGEATSKAIQELQTKLKAQEPRIVAISELTSGEPMLVWLEDIDKEETIAGMIFDYVPGRLGFKLTDIASMDRIYPRIEDYLTRWRCWTSRPDEKRRAETPWN